MAGCSTAGEISGEGLSDGGLVAIAFPRQGFDVVSAVLPVLLTLIAKVLARIEPVLQTIAPLLRTIGAITRPTAVAV